MRFRRNQERQHGVLGMVSTAIVDGFAPVKLVRFSLDDGWWLLAERDMSDPALDAIATVCIHCVLEGLDREVARGLDVARAEAEQNADGVGLALWHQAQWVTLDEIEDAIGL